MIDGGDREAVKTGSLVEEKLGFWLRENWVSGTGKTGFLAKGKLGFWQRENCFFILGIGNLVFWQRKLVSGRGKWMSDP